MTRRLVCVLLVACSGHALSTAAFAESASPVGVITNFSDFQQIDLNRVLNGDILSERGSLMNFPNGISAQTLYVLALPVEQAAKGLQLFDPSPYSELKVFAFHAMHSPCEPADFQAL